MNESNFKKALYAALTPEYEKILSGQKTEHEFSSKFNKDMQKLVKRRRKPYYKLINTVGKRIACIVIAFLVASSVTILSVKALRNAVADFYVSIFEKFSTVQPIEDDSAPLTIEDIYEITYDLSEFTIDYEEYDDYSRYITYIKDDIAIFYEQYTKDMYDVNINTEDAEISTLIINGYEAIYFQDNNQYYHLIWDNGDYIISLGSNIGKDILIDIAKSVQKVEE